jgi:hypothetical protein
MEKKEPQQESRLKRADTFWVNLADWRRERIRKSLIRPLYQEALRTVFLVAVLLIDSLFPLTLFYSFLYPYNIISTLLLLGVLLYIEARCYNAFWGKKGRWSLQKLTPKPEQRTEEEKGLKQ